MGHGLTLRGMIARTGVLLGMAALLLAATHACAGELEPRSYANTPVGLNFLIGGYSYSEGGLSTNSSLPIKDAQLRIHTEVLAYARTLDVWGALDGTYDYGGRTTVNGVQNDDVQRNSRAGVTLALPVDRNNSIKLYASTGVSTRTGSNYNLGGIAWQYRWGAGL